MGDEDITITLPDVDVVSALSIAPRVTDGVEKLWTSGWLRRVLATPEGEQVVRLFTDGHRSAVDQLLAGSAEGRERVTITVRTTAETAEALVAFVRRLYDLLSDADAMTSVGGVALLEEDREFVRPLLARAEGLIAARL